MNQLSAQPPDHFQYLQEAQITQLRCNAITVLIHVIFVLVFVLVLVALALVLVFFNFNVGSRSSAQDSAASTRSFVPLTFATIFSHTDRVTYFAARSPCPVDCFRADVRR
jgi:heme/copper-type cytochrome/quinol oxidase subunit 2